MTVKKLALTLLAIDLVGIFIAIFAGIIFGEGPDDYFGEGDLVTWMSVLQLAGIGVIAWKTGRRRGGYQRRGFWHSDAAVWAIVSFGFIYLALDEKKEFHEDFDKYIHEVFEWEETDLSDRLDDLLMGLMGLCGIAVLVAYRNEIRHYPGSIPYLVAGFVMMFVMVILDALSNRDDILLKFYQPETVELIHPWFGIVEESFKLFAEASFILGFYSAYLRAVQWEVDPGTAPPSHQELA